MMFGGNYLAAIWAFFLLLNSVLTQYCPYSECSCTGSDIICQDLGLSDIPKLITTAVGFSVLILDGNNLTTIRARSLPAQLSTISLINNPIANIDDNAFDESATTLTSISMSGASFSRIPDAIGHMQNLTYFNLFDMKIMDWNEEVMKIIGRNMLTLTLDNVGLTSWPTWITYFPKLTQLTLDTTTISSVPDDALDFLANSLAGLSISNGSLSIVPKTLSKLVALESLHLQVNNIYNLTWLPQSTKLATLMLNNNNISDSDHLSSALRPYGNSLQGMELIGNKLKTIPELYFLVLVGSLDLSFNQISDAKLGSLPFGMYSFQLSNNLLPSIPSVWTSLLKVTVLILHHNAIRAIQGTEFHNNTVEADLGYNLIREITDTSFPLNFGLVDLNLNNNPLTTISIRAFENLRALTALNLEYTKLARLPLALASLTNLFSLDISYCSDLICTCMESSLQGVILSIRQVSGQCGEMSIYDFFDILSPNCPV